jgi:hypothetical protein
MPVPSMSSSPSIADSGSKSLPLKRNPAVPFEVTTHALRLFTEPSMPPSSPPGGGFVFEPPSSPLLGGGVVTDVSGFPLSEQAWMMTNRLTGASARRWRSLSIRGASI